MLENVDLENNTITVKNKRGNITKTMNIDTGITSEVFTIKSETKLIDIFNEIISKKSEAVFEYVESLNIDINTKIVVIGTYFTGVGIVKKLSQKLNFIKSRF